MSALQLKKAHKMIFPFVTGYRPAVPNTNLILLRAHFNPRLAAWAKMTLSRTQKILMTRI